MPRKTGSPSLRKPKAKKLSELLLGAHMSISGGPSKALERGRSIGCTAIQIFVKNNMQWFAKPFTEIDLAAYREFSDRPAVVFGHTSYLINPAAKNDEFREKSIRALGEELSRADQLGLPFLVVHPGAHMGDGEETGLNRVASALDVVFRSLPGGKCKVALEITAGQGTCLGHTFEHLAAIIERSNFPDRLVACLDTAHLFEAGFDISTAEGFWETIQKFDRIVGRDRLAALHLNDSKTPLGCRVDRHEHIGKGKIGLAPFREIMRSSEFSAIPKVLETPKKEDLKEDVVNLRVLTELTA
ncbi:MAG TPA: deoxyribonuclease IV [Chthoniobacterales bacterium]|nr:deoxyribonuclease IV [Chthoniobacterales bacterium]